MKSSDELQQERLELELERLKSEIALNKAQTKKLASRGIIRAVAVTLGILVAVWTFAATFTGLLTDLSEITRKELPTARKQVDSLRARNAILQAANDSRLFRLSGGRVC